MQTNALFARWARANSPLGLSGNLKVQPEDFLVEEQADHLGEVAGTADGDHLYLFLQKRSQTTRELARSIAEANNLPIASIGYAGMKDKHAVTRQWLSVPVGAEGTGSLDVSVPDDVQELARIRQAKKLRRGWHKGNRFEITLRNLSAVVSGQDSGQGSGRIEERLQRIATLGVPNYFGAQRFGADNLSRAIAWLPRRRKERDAFKRGLHLSVLRSFLFNTVLSARIEDQTWNHSNDGSGAAEDIGGPLWGRGRVQASPEAIAFEQDALREHVAIAEELEFAGLKQERRPLKLVPEEFSFKFEAAAVLKLEFTLPPGAYATSVLRELGDFSSSQEFPAEPHVQGSAA